MEFQAISWCAKNDKEYKSRVHVFGRTAAGDAVHLEVPFEPWFYVQSKQPHAAVVARVERHLRGRGVVADACCSVTAVDFVGYKAGRRDRFSKLVFDNLVRAVGAYPCRCRAAESLTLRAQWGLRNAKDLFENDRASATYEGRVDPILKLLHERDLPPCGWLSVQVPRGAPGGDVHITVPPSALSRAPDSPDGGARPLLAPFVVCSYDIEAYSASGDFPDSSCEDDPVIQIGMTFTAVGEAPEEAQSVLLCLGECDGVEGAEVEVFDEELDMLKRWAELLQERWGCATRSAGAGERS